MKQARNELLEEYERIRQRQEAKHGFSAGEAIAAARQAAGSGSEALPAASLFGLAMSQRIMAEYHRRGGTTLRTHSDAEQQSTCPAHAQRVERVRRLTAY